MHVTKFGHCCLLIEENGLRIVTDPGSFTREQDELTDIDVILITHEHGDHLHIDSLKKMMENNPQAQVITNTAVASLLDAQGISYALIKDREQMDVKGVSIEAFEQKHALIHSTFPQVLNTGFFIANKLFYPGDAYVELNKPVEVLALPVSGPWAKSAEYTDYALAVKPKKCFPVHDGLLKEQFVAIACFAPQTVLPKHDIEFFVPKLSEPFEL